MFNKLRNRQGSSPLLPAVKETMEAGHAHQVLSLGSPESVARHARPISRLHLNSTLEAELIGHNPIAYPHHAPLSVFTSQASGLLRPYRLRNSESPDQKYVPPFFIIDVRCQLI